MLAVEQLIVATLGHQSKLLFPTRSRPGRNGTNYQLIGLNFDLDLLAKTQLIQHQLGQPNSTRIAHFHDARIQNCLHLNFTSVITLYVQICLSSSQRLHCDLMKVLGLISGTSADGIDAALCEISGGGDTSHVELLAFECAPYSLDLRERIIDAGAGNANTSEIARLNVAIGRAFGAHAARMFEKYERAELIGSHGQTVCHLPAESVTLQIGEAAIIAEMTGVAVVSDFRPSDVAAGGQGAPLVPFADWVTLRHPSRDRAILNIGGIANVTILEAAGDLSQVRAWDTGPGNMIIDALAQQFFGVPFDENGELAAQGQAQEVALDDDYFARVPPKSCGREEFGADFAARLTQFKPHDALATATALTARSIADSLRRFATFGGPYEMIVSGGGARNHTLMAMLRAHLPDALVLASQEIGIDGDAREAMAFALLAAQTMSRIPTSVVGATGARQSRILGKVSW